MFEEGLKMSIYCMPSLLFTPPKSCVQGRLWHVIISNNRAITKNENNAAVCVIECLYVIKCVCVYMWSSCVCACVRRLHSGGRETNYWVRKGINMKILKERE